MYILYCFSTGQYTDFSKKSNPQVYLTLVHIGSTLYEFFTG